MRCIFHLLKNVSTNKFDPNRLHLEKAAFRLTRAGFLIALKGMEAFPSVFEKVKKLDVSSWTLHAAPRDVFGRMSSQGAESVNSLLLHLGLWHYSNEILVKRFLLWVDRRVNIKLEKYAIILHLDKLQQQKHFMKPTKEFQE